MKISNGSVKILTLDNKELYYNANLACIKCNLNFDELEPRHFSFNSPEGACEQCDGLGTNLLMDSDRIVSNINLSINKGCIVPLGEPPWNTWFHNSIYDLCKQFQFNINDPWKIIPSEAKKNILFGTSIQSKRKKTKFKGEVDVFFEGVIPHLHRRYLQTQSGYIRDWIEKFMTKQNCQKCNGQRLQQKNLSVFIGKKNISSICELSIEEIIYFLKNLRLNNKHQEISKSIISEIVSRLEFLNDVGLGYLTLQRSATTLSGGEAQRIRLATQIGSKLMGVMYILDEPSIGLHPRDNDKLIKTLIHLKNLGNTVIVVEHDAETMKSADWIIDLGPGAGVNGGNIVYKGTYNLSLIQI